MGRRAVITVDYLYTIGTTNKLTIKEPFVVNMDDGEVGFEFSELKALREMDYKIDWRALTNNILKAGLKNVVDHGDVIYVLVDMDA